MSSFVTPPDGDWPRYGYTRQMPISIADPGRVEDLSEYLPEALRFQGCQLLQIDPAPLWGTARGADPFVLYDAWGEIIAEWELRPSLGELLEVAHQTTRRRPMVTREDQRMEELLWEVIRRLSAMSTWWRIEQEASNLYRVIAAEVDPPKSPAVACWEASSLEEVLILALERGVPWWRRRIKPPFPE
ncbi:MAG: hypothetical protein ACOC58_00190 [Chloroflexota bacterium]